MPAALQTQFSSNLGQGDLFGADTRFAGAFKANLAAMTFTTDDRGDGGLGLLVQNLRSEYRQQVSRLWEIGNGANSYFVVGRSQGEMSISRVVGPQVVTETFIRSFSDACRINKNVISLNPVPGFCFPQDSSYTSAGTGVNDLLDGQLNYDGGQISTNTGQSSAANNGSNARVYKNCILTGIALNMAAQDMLIQEQVSLMFTYLGQSAVRPFLEGLYIG